MKRIGALTIAVAMTVAACGGSNETVAEPDVQVEAVDDVVREAGDDVRVINGCHIEPKTKCPGVDLKMAYLSNADLSGATLTRTNLSRALLEGTNLTDAILQGANLTYAFLNGANLQGAWLFKADLYGAHLRDANLVDADMTGANLQAERDLEGAKFCNTTMPDGSIRNDNC